MQEMITWCLKLSLSLVLIITILTILLALYQNEWKSSFPTPKKSRLSSSIINPNTFLNNILAKSHQVMLSSFQSPPQLPILEWNKFQIGQENLTLSIENDLYRLVKHYKVTIMSNDISNYTYEKVGVNYTGPIVEGWPPAKSRHVSEYISKQTSVQRLKNKCVKSSINYNLSPVNGKLKLLIMQHSSPNHFEARQSSRNTWMKFLKVLI